MKRNSYIIIVMLLSLTLIISAFSIAPVAYADSDTEGPQVDLDSLVLSHYKITDPNIKPTVKLKVTDQSEIESVEIYYNIGTAAAARGTLKYNAETGYCEGTLKYDSVVWSELLYTGKFPGYYGVYELDMIVAADAYGNYTWLTDLDVPAASFEVIGGNPKDKTAPVIDYNNIKVDKKVGAGEPAFMTIPVSDESEIINVEVCYRNLHGDMAYSTITKKSKGLYQARLYFYDVEGEYQIEYIYATDENYNYTIIKNSDYYDFNDNTVYDNKIIASLGHLNVQHGDIVPTDLTASVKSIELSDGIINRNSQNATLTVTFDASYPLKNAEVAYGFTSESASHGMGIDASEIDEYTFYVTLPSTYYGEWELEYLVAIDIYGNRSYIYDVDWPTNPGDELQQEDLSDGNFLVGIIDSDTGLGVSDTRLDDTTELTVEEEALNSDLCHEMVQDDGTGVAFYDVEVEGSRDDETAVSFVAPEGFIDGDEVTVVHQKHDGTNETFEAEVKNGRITIETEEFSPFLIQVDKDHGHRFSAQKILSKATFSKNGNALKKCYGCDATGQAVKIKPAKASLSKENYAYTGKYISSSKLPKVVVKDGNGKIIPSKYYTVKKPANVKKMKAIGRYPYKITFKNSCKEYTGSKTIYLKITPKKTSITSVKGEKKALTVKWKKGNRTQVTGYQVMTATNSKFTKNTKTVNLKGYTKTSAKVSKLKSKTKYYVKVRTYKTVKGIKIYSDWSGYKYIKTK